MRGSKHTVSLLREERQELEQLCRRHNAPQKLVRRARIVVLADAGKKYGEIAQQLG